MVGETSNRTVWVGVLVSVALHLGTAWLLFASREPSAEAAFHRPESAPPQEKKIDLGDPESTAMSMSWLGMDEYRRHIAAASEVDQPELTMDPAAPTSAPSAAQVASAMARAQRAARAAQAEAERMVEELAGGLRALRDWGGAIPIGQAARPAGEADQAEEEKAREEALAEASEADPGEDESRDTERPEPGEALAESPPSPASEGAAGQQDDRESDATSVQQMSRKELGSPLSARGLRIQTVKPQFSHYASIMSSPHDPVIRIHFGRDGRAALVELLQSSGFGDIDRPVLDAAYRWRAEGKALKSLGGSETISIDMRILL